MGFEFNCFDSRASDKVIHISLCTAYFKQGLPMTFVNIIYSVCTLYNVDVYCVCMCICTTI